MNKPFFALGLLIGLVVTSTLLSRKAQSPDALDRVKSSTKYSSLPKSKLTKVESDWLAKVSWVEGDTLWTNAADDKKTALNAIHLALYKHPRLTKFASIWGHNVFDFAEEERYVYDRKKKTLTFEVRDAYANGPWGVNEFDTDVTDDIIHRRVEMESITSKK